MIRVARVAEPENFDAECRQPGQAWLREHPDSKRPRDYWSPFKPQLANGFHDLCGYSAMYEPVGTVDHFASWDEAPQQAYEWSNFRYASGWINSSKQTARVLDPFEVGDDWFEIILPSLQLVLNNRVPEQHRALAEFTLKRLHLCDDERVMKQRRKWMELFESGELTLDGLRKNAPLLARAIDRQQSELARRVEEPAPPQGTSEERSS